MILSEIENGLKTISLDAAAAATPLPLSGGAVATTTAVGALLRGRYVEILGVEKAESTEIGTTAEKAIEKATQTIVLDVPPAFKNRFGLIGEKLAQALTLFSLDVVGIVVEYTRGLTEKDIRFEEGLTQICKYLKPSVYLIPLSEISPEVRLRFQSMGPGVTELNLLDQETLLHRALPRCQLEPFFTPLRNKAFNAQEIDLISQYFPNLQSLKLSCQKDVASHLHKLLPQLCHLQVRTHGGYDIGDFSTLTRSISQLPLKTLTLFLTGFHCADYDPVGDLSPSSTLTELRVFSSLTAGSVTFLRQCPNIKKLGVKGFNTQFDQSTHNLKDLPLEVILCDGEFDSSGRMHKHEYPKTLQTFIFKDCNGIDYEKIKKANPAVQVILLDSKKDSPEKIKSVLEEHFTL